MGARLRLDQLPPAMQAQALAQLERETKLAPVGEILPRKDAPENGANRMRQARAPKLNKTETAFEAHLKATMPAASVKAHALTLLLANGCRYTPDFIVERDRMISAYETKGFMRDDAAVKLKVAASVFPWITFYLVTRRKMADGGGWSIERVES